MATVKLKIAELRKSKGIGQQDLAEVLGVSFQTVSKWETGTTMPDISLLPDIAAYFNVSVDELLGLKPLRQQAYIPRNTDNRDNWNGKTDKLYQNRKYFWNDDYLQFLIKNVWHIESPIDVIDFRCGDGYLGIKLLELLPQGSTCTGVDNEYFTDKTRLNFGSARSDVKFIVSDIYSLEPGKKYDLAICQAGLRHMNRPMEVLKKMVAAVKKNSLIVCVEVNREFESDGHTRAVAAHLAGWDAVPVYWDEDELDMRAYVMNVRWCDEEDVHKPIDLAKRIVSHKEYEHLWRKRCMEVIT